jgi:hypothetical protein
MGKMKELEDKLKKLEKMKQINTLPTSSKTTFIPWIAVGCVYSGQGAEK